MDIFTGADIKTARRYGINNPVQRIEIGKIHSLLEELKIGQEAAIITEVSGGGAANVAKIAGYLGLEAGFSGALGMEKPGIENKDSPGPDHYGRLFSQNLISAGVKLFTPLKPSPSGLCLYLKVGEENRIIASPSAALELRENDIPEEELKKAKVLVIEGFLLERKELISHILRLSSHYGIPAALDLGSPYFAEKYAGDIMEYTRSYPLILFMNQDEGAAFAKALTNRAAMGPKGEADFAGLSSFFCSFTGGKDFPIVALKLGAGGAACFAQGEVFRAETTEIKNAESTGAGDAFCAGFLKAWIQGKALATCTVLGNKCAALVLDAAGSQIDGEGFNIDKKMDIN